MDPSIKKDIKPMIKSARKQIAAGEFEKAVETCQKILEIENCYLAHVFMGASYVGLVDCLAALKHLKCAIELDGSQMLAYEGLGRLFEKFSEDLSEEVKFCKEIFNKMAEFLKDNEEKRKDMTMKYLKIFHKMEDSKGIYLTTSSLLTAAHYEDEPENIKHYVAFEFINSIQGGDIRFENATLNQTIGDQCNYLMRSELSDEAIVELAWKVYFRVSNNCTGIHKLWPLATEVCPLPYCRFNAERVLLMFMETFPAHELKEVLEYAQALPNGNNVLNLFNAFFIPDVKKAIDSISQVILQEKLIIVAYVKMCLLYCKVMDFENAIKTAKTGWESMKEDEAVLHCARHEMLNQFNLALLQAGFRFGAIPQLEATELVSRNKITFWQTLNSLRHLQWIEEAERDIDNGLVLLSQEHDKTSFEKNVNSYLWTETYYLHSSKAIMLLSRQQFEESQKFFDLALGNGGVEDHLIYYHKSLLHWQLLKKMPNELNEDCRNNFIECITKCIQLQALDALPFHLLGLYFSQVLSNPLKAKDFLLKAYELDQSNNECIMMDLVDCLIRLDNQALTLAYLNDILRRMNNKCSKWVYLRLGSYHLKHHDQLQAICYLQQAVRIDVNNHHSWERLGEAYMQRGSYQAAMKAFNKALNIHESLYSLYQKAIILQKLGEMESSIEAFNRVILNTPDYLPALYGLSVTQLECSKAFVSSCLLKRAQSQLQLSINHASKGCEINADFSCLWKCLADSFTCFYHFGKADIQLQVPEYLENRFSFKKTFESSSTHSRLHLLKMGERCYMTALRIRPDQSSLWYDLVLNLLWQAKTLIVDSQTTNKEAFARLMLKRAFQAGRKCIEFSPCNFLYWNLLGVVAATRPIEDSSIAQHCFIKSIELQSHNEIAWSNLGFLYLINLKLELAHEAFNRAQSVDPSFGNSWIGQALIAERCMDSGGVDELEAMDLFRHSVEICDHPEAILGYAYWVCHTMDQYEVNKLINNNNNNNNNNIIITTTTNNNNNNNNNKDKASWIIYSFEHLSAVFSASDALVKFLEIRPEDGAAWNLYALLNEGQLLLQTSCHALERAVGLLERDKEEHKHAAILRANYARLLMKTGKYDRAVGIYTALKGLSFHHECLLALTHYKAGQFAMCCEAYFNARDKTNDLRLLEMVSVALGVACHCLHDHPSAKQFLFENIGKDHVASKETLTALLCFAILTRELDLIKAVVMEVEKVDRERFHSLLVPLNQDLAFLLTIAGYYLKKFQSTPPSNDFVIKYSSIKHLATSIRLFPNQSKPLSRMAVYFLAGVSIDDDLTACDDVIGRLCRSAINNDDKLHFQEALQCSVLSHLSNSTLTKWNYNSDSSDKGSAVSSIKNANPDPGMFHEAQQLVLLYPDKLQNWCLLLASCQHRIAERHVTESSQSCHDDLDYLTSFVERISKHLINMVEQRLMKMRDDPYLRCMHQWLSRQRVVAMLMSNCEKGDVRNFLQNATWLYEEDKTLGCLRKLMDGDGAVLVEAIKDGLNVSQYANKSSLNYLKVYLLFLLSRGNSKEEVLDNIKSIKLIAENKALNKFIENVFK